MQAAGSAQSLDKLLIVCRPVESLAQKVAGSRTAAGEILVAYAQEVASIQDEARRLQSRRSAAESRLEVAENALTSIAQNDPNRSATLQRAGNRINDEKSELRRIEQLLVECDQARLRADAKCAAAISGCAAALQNLEEVSGGGSGSGMNPVRTVGLVGRKPPNSYQDLDAASKMSYEKLAEWMASSDGQTILSIAKANPSRFNDILDNAIDIKASKWWSIFALAYNLIGFDGTSTTAAAFKMYENFRTGEVWDMKVYLTEAYGRKWEDGAFMLTDGAGHTVRSDVFGNVNYGAMLARWGVDLDTALRGANAGGETGMNNDNLDDRAVEFGYELYLKYPEGMTEKQYSEELANANLY